MSKSSWNEEQLFSSVDHEWETPQDLFEYLDGMFHFEIDLAASRENTKCELCLTEKEDSLSRSWIFAFGPKQRFWRGFLNPPYGRMVGRFIEKCYNESRKGMTIVVVTMVRSDTKWWTDYVSKAAQVQYIEGRLSFEKDGVPSENAAPAPSCVIVFTPWSEGPPQYVTLRKDEFRKAS